ncbi:DUF262 domain-containing protein [uncultured Sphingomonas sp.]|uniref:DUF262 domain-containing protein n=1 Tax=uncultured Sphingomonas sp. TaxID=158754 RepID=UPI0025F16080|nr:DUF262 domain-containing protein [uncultured Sphingomonas sp.]
MRSDKRELDKVYKRRDRYEIPDWQRDEVWDPPRKQALIDSILRGWRLPKFYFVASSTKPISYEVVDGQQRLATIFEFLSDELELTDDTAAQFGGKKYSELPDDVSDRVDDFEIDFDEIEDASDDELMEFFQRLQSGLQLNSSERLNAINSKLKTFCKKMSKHKFFTDKVAFDDKRYAHFDVMAKVAALEVEGVGAGLRYSDVKAVFETQKNFSDKSQVAIRIKGALDFLASAIPNSSPVFRSRSMTQSFITMICHLHGKDALKDKESQIAKFAESFVSGLASEVEKGQGATDIDFISFQKSINANVKTGPITRDRVLLRKLFQFDPNFLEAADADAAAAADFSGEIVTISKEIRGLISSINAVYSSLNGNDLFKATNKTAIAQAELSNPIKSYSDYKSLIDNLYFLFWEGPGSKLTEKPESFKDINALRTEEQHDVDHGSASKVKGKKIKHGDIFRKYCGIDSPIVASPAQFPLLQLSLLRSIHTDLKHLLIEVGSPT